MKEKPIGIFDSGVGGLTVARSVIDRLPGERIVYLGDDARGPYGPRDIGEVREFAHQIIEYLIGFGVKLVVIACNSATAAALAEAQRDYDIPIVGVIAPGVRAALRHSKRLHIGVIGTRVTIDSGSYERAIVKIDPRARVFGQACPEFVEFVERGEVTGDHVMEIALGYIEPMLESGIDTLIMGCTHYPLLAPLLREVVGSGVDLINSADATAADIEEILDRLGWLADRRSGSIIFLTTGNVEKCQELGRMFLGPEVRKVVAVSLDEHPELDFAALAEEDTDQ
ncbi:MAG: glutamate racemase [Candidatus Anoxymicrobium japonicum]|uniref:Glutamate racemase n=1 Tax=Candidatus Anoxymicrobium japonicum TaxID=2013648 RepID=A0A2N3G894_9ACTN|nr:MAG: glutamate racemase [Candidatus Anoxymicrobium japonicum]